MAANQVSLRYRPIGLPMAFLQTTHRLASGRPCHSRLSSPRFGVTSTFFSRWTGLPARRANNKKNPAKGGVLYILVLDETYSHMGNPHHSIGDVSFHF